MDVGVPRLKTFVLVRIALGLACIAPAPTAAQPSNDALLRQFCDARNIKGDQCLNARRYPNKARCNVELDGPRVEGRFLSSEVTTVIAVYHSDCEPHANNFGGSVLFERKGAAYIFKGYQQGLVVNHCTVIAKGGARDRLICTTGYLGQGFLESTVSDIVLAQDFSKAVKADTDVLATATDSEGARGANTVQCDKTLALFSFSGLKPGPAPDTVLVEATFADAAVIKRACAPGARPPKEALSPADKGEAYVAAGDVKSGRFVLELASRKLVPEAEFGKR